MLISLHYLRNTKTQIGNQAQATRLTKVTFKQDKQSYKFGIITKILIINNHLIMIQEEFLVVENPYDQPEHSIIRNWLCKTIAHCFRVCKYV